MYILVLVVSNIMSLSILCQGARAIRNHTILQAKGGIFLVQRGCTFFFCPKGFSLPWSKEFLLGPTIVEDENTIPIGRLKKGIARSSIVKLKKMHNNVVCRQNRALANQK
jgi:hypothetical protein